MKGKTMKLNYKLGWLPVVLPVLFASTLTGAQAQWRERDEPRESRPGPMVREAADIAHRAMRDKILHEAHDRFDVRFDTTDVTSLGRRGEREVTGRGIFRRRGKEPQRFTYHITVNPREGVAFRAGYDIR